MVCSTRAPIPPRRPSARSAPKPAATSTGSPSCATRPGARRGILALPVVGAVVAAGWALRAELHHSPCSSSVAHRGVAVPHQRHGPHLDDGRAAPRLRPRRPDPRQTGTSTGTAPLPLRTPGGDGLGTADALAHNVDMLLFARTLDGVQGAATGTASGALINSVFGARSE